MKRALRLLAVLNGCLIFSLGAWCLPSRAMAEEPAAVTEHQNPPSQERIDAAMRLLEIKGAREGAIKGCLAGLEQQRSINPALTESLYLALKEEMTSDENIDAFVLMLATNFAVRFATGELNELAAFYGTPLGKRLAAEETDLALEVMESGRKWGAKLGEKVDKAMLKKKDLR